jgi:hypothetical protein
MLNSRSRGNEAQAKLTLDGLFDLDRIAAIGRMLLCCACTHYLVFKEPASPGSPGCFPRAASAIPTKPTPLGAISFGEPFEFSLSIRCCQQLSACFSEYFAFAQQVQRPTFS